MIVLNGARGVSEMLGKVMTQGVAGLELARNLLAHRARTDGRRCAARAQRRSRDRARGPAK